ncbi:MAG: hypothetical protein A3F17_07685 [Gammaproteobacteria bacterium RIFCSPHIGHO2_12_FULL_41_15]|nr:MAG: hypothetical protein A3F17_07685 [Gammaproteobacteria bacterium RIFCSPHIGHO2_12_FULL_41_15]
MPIKDVFFTTKVASDKTFCNREQESRLLLSNIQKNQHTVIVAPRRYGKTSLVVHTLMKEKCLCARIDLFCVVYEEDVCRKIANGISKLIREISTFSEKTMKLLEQCFKSAYIGFKAGQIEIKVEFGKTAATPITQAEELLEGLEKFAEKHKKRVVLFFDEFQDVLKVDETNKIQAAIRVIAQHTKYVNYIFSGSSRKMLNNIFDDKTQPLYMLCNKIILDRIERKHFENHIQKAAKKQWGSSLSNEIVSLILESTEVHSYYVNVLCDKLWDSTKKPTEDNIRRCWNEVLAENKGKIIADLEHLNTNRIKVITVTALLGVVSEPNSKVFLDQVKLPLSTVQHTVKYLMNHDYLYHDKEGLKLVDPIMKKFIVERYRDKN